MLKKILPIAAGIAVIFSGFHTNLTFAASAPTARAGSATSITSSSVVLNGSVDPKGINANYSIEYKKASDSSWKTADSGTLSFSSSVSKKVTGLSANTSYQFRVKAQNGYGSFTTPSVFFETEVASAPNPPVDNTARPDAVATSASASQNSATLYGTVDPNNLTTNYRFEYGIGNFSNTAGSGSLSGDGAKNVSVYISSLPSNTTYQFRIVASNSKGENISNTKLFTTSGSSQTGSAPSVTLNSAYGITRDAASLQGYVNPNNAWTEYWFEYGTQNDNLWQKTSTWSIGSSTSNTNVSTSIYNLSTSTTYYYRLVACNSYGTNYSSTWSFTTSGGGTYYGSPYVQTINATSVYNSSATLNAEITSNGSQTDVWFEYGYAGQGLSRSSGSSTINSSDYSRSVSIQVSDLTQNTRYEFRAVARNAYGTNYGEIISFTTSGSVISYGQPQVVTVGYSNVTQTATVLQGRVNPENSNATLWFEYGTSAFDLRLKSSSVSVTYQTGFKDYYITASGLSANTLYFYRAVAQNPYGADYGEIKFFRTAGSVVNPPIIVTPTGDLNVFLDPSVSNLEPEAGDTLDYVLIYRNASKGKITAASLKVALPFDTEYVDSNVKPSSWMGNNLVFYVGDIQKGAQGAVTIKVKIDDKANKDSNLMFNSFLEYTDASKEFQTVNSYIAVTVGGNGNAGFLASLSVFAKSITGSWLFLLLFLLMLVAIIYLIVTRRKDKHAQENAQS
ncbi:MAG: fibronectin type III domain-containing protein [Parcubacteria group bacterium]